MWLVKVFMLVIATPIALYFYRYLIGINLSLGASSPERWKKLIFVAAAVSVGLSALDIFSITGMAILHFVVISLFFSFVNLVIKGIAGKKYLLGFSVWKKVHSLGIIPLLLTALICISGYVNMNCVVHTDYAVSTNKSIREEGYRIALIADVHFGISLSEKELSEKCREISAASPDIVILCGDIIDDNASFGDAEVVFQALSEIKSEFGIFYVYGNHDRQNYSNNKAYSEKELENVIESRGIKILKDEICLLNGELLLVGREDKGMFSVDGRKPLSELIQESDLDKYIITLDHQPNSYEENGIAGTNLLLSGHTHGGQIWPINLIMRLFGINDAVYGLTEIDSDTSAIVTSGFAGWGFPIKTASPAEYVIIDIIQN